MRKVIAVVAAIACSQWLVDAERTAATGVPNGGPRDRSRAARLQSHRLLDRRRRQRADRVDQEREDPDKDQRQEPEAALEARDRQSAAGASLADAGAGDRAAEHAVRRRSRSGIVNGISDNLYAFDVETGKILWQKHWDYPAPAGRGGGGGGAAPQPIRRISASCSPAAAATRRSSVRRTRRAGGRSTSSPATACSTSSTPRPARTCSRRTCSTPARAGRSIWSAIRSGWRTPTPAPRFRRCRLDDPQHKVMNFNAGSGGAWGRRGAAMDSTGTAWTTTGDGIYDPTSDPPRYANSVVGVHIVEQRAEAEGLLHADNWDWLRKRDLDPNNTPTIFNYKGRELMAASGKECRVYLLDPEVARRRRSPDAAVQDAALLQRGSGLSGLGSWGACPRGKMRAARAGCWRRSGVRCTRRPSSRS